MTNEDAQLVGKAMGDVAEGRQQLAVLKAKAANLSESLDKISRGLAAPENIRFLDSGVQMAQARGNPGIVLLHQSDFKELSYESIRQLVEEIQREERRVRALEQRANELKTAFHIS